MSSRSDKVREAKTSLHVSVLCLGGLALLNVWQEPGMGFFGVVFVGVLLVFLAATSIRLFERRRGAFRLAWCLLLLYRWRLKFLKAGAKSRASLSNELSGFCCFAGKRARV